LALFFSPILRVATYSVLGKGSFDHGTIDAQEGISKVLEANQQILNVVYADLVGLRKTDTGRTGMTAEQVCNSRMLVNQAAIAVAALLCAQ